MRRRYESGNRGLVFSARVTLPEPDSVKAVRVWLDAQGLAPNNALVFMERLIEICMTPGICVDDVLDSFPKMTDFIDQDRLTQPTLQERFVRLAHLALRDFHEECKPLNIKRDELIWRYFRSYCQHVTIVGF